ncbi:hypothetical protein NLS1_01590 [Nocardioides sp. LS1]|nr:hypothetical protein NLS1_01590 [Nocardioides sp. LS1]
MPSDTQPTENTVVGSAASGRPTAKGVDVAIYNVHGEHWARSAARELIRLAHETTQRLEVGRARPNPDRTAQRRGSQ